MKIKITAIVLSLLLGTVLTSCGENGGVGEGKYTMRARITELGGEILVDVIEAPHGNTGPFFVIASGADVFGIEGEKITRNELAVGDVVDISYGGQVMMSYPPQIMARKITLIAKK